MEVIVKSRQICKSGDNSSGLDWNSMIHVIALGMEV